MYEYIAKCVSIVNSYVHAMLIFKQSDHYENFLLNLSIHNYLLLEDYFDSAWYFDAGEFYFPVSGTIANIHTIIFIFN